MSNKPPPFVGFIGLGQLPEATRDELLAKMLAGEYQAYVYSTEAKGDLSPVAIEPAKFFYAWQHAKKQAEQEDEDQRDDNGWHLLKLDTYQIRIPDTDQRRPSRIRRKIGVPHWIYASRKDLPAVKPARVGPGAAEQYDWDDIEQFVRELFRKRGDFLKSENRVEGWRSQNNMIEIVKDYLQRTKQPIPGVTQFKDKVAEILERIRSELPADH